MLIEPDERRGGNLILGVVVGRVRERTGGGGSKGNWRGGRGEEMIKQSYSRCSSIL